MRLTGQTLRLSGQTLRPEPKPKPNPNSNRPVGPQGPFYYILKKKSKFPAGPMGPQSLARAPASKSGPAASKSGPAAFVSGPAAAMAPAEGMAARARLRCERAAMPAGAILAAGVVYCQHCCCWLLRWQPRPGKFRKVYCLPLRVLQSTLICFRRVLNTHVSAGSRFCWFEQPSLGGPNPHPTPSA